MNNSVIQELNLNKETKAKNLDKPLYRTIQRYNIPTSELYNNLIKLIYRINTELFDGLLPEVMLRFAKDGGKCGKINNDSWQKDNHICYEIILNPDITKKDHKELLISLVHTLCHLQQIINKKTSRNSYHNTVFSDKMFQMGLKTICNKDNDKSIGQNVNHEIKEGGNFEKLFLNLKDDDFIPWHIIAKSFDEHHKKSNNKNKVAYKCDKCNTKVWGKPDLNINCNKCNNPFKKCTNEA